MTGTLTHIHTLKGERHQLKLTSRLYRAVPTIQLPWAVLGSEAQVDMISTASAILRNLMLILILQIVVVEEGSSTPGLEEGPCNNKGSGRIEEQQPLRK